MNPMRKYEGLFVFPPEDAPEAWKDEEKRLEETLNSEPDVRTKAAPILRTLIDEIVLHPGDKRGKMSIEVYGEPSALFLLASEAPAPAANCMDKFGSGGGTRTPDTRIMIPLL